MLSLKEKSDLFKITNIKNKSIVFEKQKTLIFEYFGIFEEYFVLPLFSLKIKFNLNDLVNY
jgi:hypothetical protein